MLGFGGQHASSIRWETALVSLISAKLWYLCLGL